MVAVPIATPVTTPDTDPTFTVASGLDQIPPVVPSDKVKLEPKHNESGPVITVGDAFTVITLVIVQPGAAYAIVVVPASIPKTDPEDEPIDAIEGAELVHVPPAAPSDRLVVRPIHTVLSPVMAGITVTVVVAKLVRPLPSVTVRV